MAAPVPECYSSLAQPAWPEAQSSRPAASRCGQEAMIEGTRYPSYDEIRRRRLAERRAAALQALGQADALVRRSGGRLVVFGSLVEGGFTERSDLDVALFGVPPERDDAVATEVDTVLTLAGFGADVVPERFLPPTLRQRVLAHGREPGALV